MKWLLVTTNPTPHVPGTNHPDNAGWNVGDVFARLGTEQVIRMADPSAQFDYLNIDLPESLDQEREFDFCVFAGRPLFWLGCETSLEWSKILPGWACEEAKRVIAIGVGDCYPLPRDESHVAGLLKSLQGKMALLTTRSNLPVNLPQQYVSMCPSAWLLSDRKEKPTRKLCNFMMGGGHYPSWAEEEYQLWLKMMPELAKKLIDNGYDFIAHTLAERNLALVSGWKPESIVYSTNIDDYLDAYASAERYIGNRMHGATILASRRAVACAIGYDSRKYMVMGAGHAAVAPSELDVDMELNVGLDFIDDARVKEVAKKRDIVADIIKNLL